MEIEIDEVDNFIFDNMESESDGWQSTYTYDVVKKALEDWGKLKWEQAQTSAAEKQIELKKNTGNAPLFSKTNYK